MADEGIKAVIDGKDITSTTPEDYLIWSKYYNLKALDLDASWPTSVTIPASTYNASYTITHSLGYNPLYNLFFKDQSGRIVHIPGQSTDAYATRGRILSETVNAITVRLGHSVNTHTSDRIYEVFHFIYVDPNSI